MITWTRRRWMAATGIGSLSISEILAARAAQAAAGGSTEETAVIFVGLGGGPSQFETWDPKPDAPLEYRGNFKAISTAVPGTSFCELLPKQAAIADKLTILRAIAHEEASHIAMHLIETGYYLQNSANTRTGEMPAFGSIVAKMRDVPGRPLPAFVSLPRMFAYSGPQYLGSAYKAFEVREDPNEDDFAVANVALHDTLDTDRLEDRRGLLKSFDEAQRGFDELGSGLDRFTQQAFDLVSGPAAREAFDMNRETPEMRDAYGRTSLGQRMLLARRLVEAGVPFVAVRMGDWDDHIDLPKRITPRAEMFDQCLSTLISDIHDRGLARKVLVVAMGEFGRTPKVNVKAGRDHWPGVMSVLVAGGKYKMGEVIGASDHQGARPIASIYRPENVLGMMYRHLGIDPGIAFNNFAGRPRYILERREPIVELM